MHEFPFSFIPDTEIYFECIFFQSLQVTISNFTPTTGRKMLDPEQLSHELVHLEFRIIPLYHRKEHSAADHSNY